MKNLKKPLLFSLSLLPVAIIGGYFVTIYQLNMFSSDVLESVTVQVGSTQNLTIIAVVQSVIYALLFGFLGYIISSKIGLMKPIKLEAKPLTKTLGFSAIMGIIFSLDYWTFGKWIPELNIAETTKNSLTPSAWISSVLYGGVIEEVLLRLFFMSLIVLILWKVFQRKAEVIPTSILVVSNVIAALIFAAGHLPATIMFFGGLTPLLVFRCFLLNGGFALYFGYVYRKHGIQYAMISHATLHIISKLILTFFAN